MVSGLITSWQIDRETVETVRLYFLGLINHCRCHHACSHEIKRCLLLGRKVMTNLNSILKSRDIVNKVLSIQGYGFSICMEVRVGLSRNLSAEELMLLNCGVGENS